MSDLFKYKGHLQFEILFDGMNPMGGVGWEIYIIFLCENYEIEGQKDIEFSQIYSIFM